jgi:hypothetical protein
MFSLAAAALQGDGYDHKHRTSNHKAALTTPHSSNNRKTSQPLPRVAENLLKNEIQREF